MKPEKIVILDAGGQYAKVIDRKVRELGVESDLLPLNTSVTKLQDYAAIIISGGPQSVYGISAPKYDHNLLKLDKPILGICYGMQLLAHAEGGKVNKKQRREDGPCLISVDPQSLLFAGLNETQTVLMSHGDSVSHLPKNYEQIAQSGNLIAAIANSSAKKYGVQFHPEVDLTENGQKMLSNFLFKIVQLKASFTLEDREKKAIAYIKSAIGDKQVLLLASGGVDSTVCAALLQKALKPEQIIALHVDSGFMRQDESQAVKIALAKIGINLTVIDAKQDFFAAKTKIAGQEIGPLTKITDPQVKRKIIGDTFIKVTENYLRTLNLDLDNVFLAQGTLRPDLIESASKNVSQVAATIKTHHNDTEIVRALRERGRVIEPLAEYHKDEVRQLGLKLGLPNDLVWRQPFPGPGLAIRILCAETAYFTADHDNIIRDLEQFVPAPYLATLLPIRSVGVQGDGRTYSYAVALGIEKNELVDWNLVFALAREIPKLFHQINRVVFVFNHAKTSLIKKITPTFLTDQSLSKLRMADKIVNDLLQQNNLLQKISQVPVILIPIDFDGGDKHSVVIRPFMTNDFMTGLAATPGKEIPLVVIENMVEQILQKVAGVSRVLYDLTSKPPGTTEWE